MVIDRFVKSAPGSIIRIHQLESGHIQEYLYQLRDQGFKNRTLNAHLTAIKSFCKFYSKRFRIANPGSEITLLSEDPPNSRFLTEKEYNKVLSLASQLARDRIVFLANTGLRASEFASLRPSSYNHNQSSITITGKGRKQRTIPLNHSARDVLTRLTCPATPNALWLQFSRLSVKADIPKFGPHALRHYFATQLILKGVPIAIVSKLLGHASTKTTESCYAHILHDDLRHVTDVLD
jgi:site-specific recombinase XerD